VPFTKVGEFTEILGYQTFPAYRGAHLVDLPQ
jgi:hypothetical protein